MKIKIKIILFSLLCSALLISACGADKAEVKHEVTVLAAASLKDVMEELKTKYEEKEEDTELTLSFGSSGALMAQIEEGAPADVFFSADTKQMDELNEKGFITEGSIVPLLENRLVLVVPENSTKNITSFEDAVSKADVIGLGEPESVPAGRYAEEVFDYLGILDKVRTKANYGSDVRTVLTWVEEGGADCGVVYKTDAYSSDKVRIV
ncbi:MAG: molybdate ABC transporter substrate-binding protein, partial [Lachnospiraceae bacterium]|nr:molybdate ABC transporter substrate-binding protein [Lachnospiraceae bacterium]